METHDRSTGTGEVAGYRLGKELRRTTAGVDFRAERVDDGRVVTVQVLAATRDGSPDGPDRRRFVREARAVAELDHPHIAAVDELGDQAEPLHLVRRHVEATDLGSLLAAGGPLELDRAVAIVEQVAGALDAAHDEGIVHRGVDAQHVLVEQRAGGDLHAYLADFGLVDGLAPEQLGGDPVDGRADVYGLGALLYRCLTGEVLFAGPDPDTVRRRHLHDPPPRLPGGRTGLDGVLAVALHKDPRRRYPSCGRLAEALRALVAAPAGETTRPVGATVTGPVGTPPSVEPSRAAHRRVPVLVLLAALLTAAVVAGVLLLAGRFPNDREAALLSTVPADYRDTCTRGAGETALRCTPDDGAAELLVQQFTSADSVAAGYEAVLRRAAVPADTGDCASGTGGEHAYSGTGSGRVVCFGDPGSVTVAWTDDDRGILATATAPADQAVSLGAWWAGHVGAASAEPFPTAAEQSLLDRLLEEDCDRAGDLAVHPGATAGVQCRPLTGEAGSVRYYQFDDEAALQAVLAEDVRETGAPEVDGRSCTDQPPEFLAVGPWSIGGIEVGRVLCHTASDGQAVLRWTHDGLRLLGVVEGGEPAAVSRYWFRTVAVFPALTDADPFPTAQEQALLDHVPAPVQAGCQRYEVPPGLLRSPDELVAVACEPPGQQVGVIYKSYADLDAMTFSFDVFVDAVAAPEGQDCTGAPELFLGVTDYTVSGARIGRLACHSFDGAASIAWTNDPLLITAEAFAADAPLLLEFWRTSAGPWPAG